MLRMGLLVVGLLTSTLALQAQKTQEVEFSAAGCCPMCESSILGALDVKGVKNCSWDQYAQVATVVFKPGKVTLDALQKRIAETGRDTDLHKATDEAYGELPGCCQYRGENGCGKKHEE
jgi:mercuric ion binding protein